MEPKDVKDLNDMHLMLAELFETVYRLEDKLGVDKNAKKRADSARKWIDETKSKFNK
jgi:predicted translin family RNA/ssDNA-binding protein